MGTGAIPVFIAASTLHFVISSSDLFLAATWVSRASLHYHILYRQRSPRSKLSSTACADARSSFCHWPMRCSTCRSNLQEWTSFASQMIEITIILATIFPWKKDGIIIFVRYVRFSHKIEHKHLTDPSPDVTDDYSIQGRFCSNYVFLKQNDASGYSPTG